MKRKFKVMGDTRKDGTSPFLDIELDLVLEDDSLGTSCNVLGGSFTITQNGKILVLANNEWTLTLIDITPEPEKVVPKLIINETLEIYLETKEIAVKCKCTYEELCYALADEWKILSKMVGTTVFGQECPFDYSERLQLFTFKDEWGFEGGNFSLLGGGSFTRLNKEGRSI